jgi:hypothetical protein
MKIRRSLGEDEDYLTEMFDKTDKGVIYNNVKYQKLSNAINTCGDHVCCRIYKFKHNNMMLPQYYKMMKTIKEKSGYAYDEISSVFVDPWI